MDSDFANSLENEGEIAFAFMNITREQVVIEAGEKLGQGIFVKYGIVEDDDADGVRSGGFRKYWGLIMEFNYGSRSY